MPVSIVVKPNQSMLMKMFASKKMSNGLSLSTCWLRVFNKSLALGAILSLLSAAASVRAATIVVNTVNNETPGPEETSLHEAISALQDGDTIQFNIPGAGPHVIQTPIGGYPLITAHSVTIDGYSQPGAAPNTNPILGGNNAQIKIVLDSTGAESEPNPQNPELPLRRSTRLDFPEFSGNTGFGGSENGVLAIFGGDNVTIRGLSFIARHTPNSDNDPVIYAVALVREATNCLVQGCWFGLAPGDTTMADVKPVGSAVAAFRWRIDGDVFSSGLIFGTDGDGTNDRAEFNVTLGSRIALAIELPNTKISGNYFNVFPDGLTFVNVETIYEQLVALEGGESVESIENGRVADNTTIGTDGDGVSDEDERNIFAHSVYNHDIEVYTAGTNIVIAGNYFGVGIDGMAAALVPTNAAPDLVSLPGTSSVRVGSNGDGVSDDLEGNLIVNLPGDTFVSAGSSVPIVARRNQMVNTGVYGVPFGEGQNGRAVAAYYASVVVDPALARPQLTSLSSNRLDGSYGAPTAGFPNTVLDLYLVDAKALGNRALAPGLVVQPTTWLASYSDNGTGDLDPDPNEFSFDVSSFGLSESTYVTVLVTYSPEANAQNAGIAITSPSSNPIAVRPTLFLYRVGDAVELSWPAPAGAFTAQQNETLFNPDPNSWFDVGAGTYTDGNNTVSLGIDFFATLFFRLISQ